jgi:hypothetical protein
MPSITRVAALATSRLSRPSRAAYYLAAAPGSEHDWQRSARRRPKGRRTLAARAIDREAGGRGEGFAVCSISDSQSYSGRRSPDAALVTSLDRGSAVRYSAMLYLFVPSAVNELTSER